MSAPAVSTVPRPDEPQAVVSIHDMDDATLESAAILAVMTHQQTGRREHLERVQAINAEQHRRRRARHVA